MQKSWEIFRHTFIDKGGYNEVLSGLETTVIIAVVGLLIGIVIGTIIAVTKVVPQYSFKAKFFSKLSDIYVAIFRGTPMVVQLLVVYFVLFPELGIKIDKTYVAVIVFGMNSGAYVSEIMRSGILSIDKGQMEAGRALGMSYGKTMLKVVIPQAVKNIIPTLGNEFIALIKDTSVVSFIAVVDLTRAFRSIADSNYEYIVPYLMLALVYLVIVLIITLGIKALEKKFARSERSYKQRNRDKNKGVA